MGAEDVGDPVVDVVGLEGGSQRRQHSEDWPDGQALFPLLAEGVYGYEDKDSQQNLERLDVREELSAIPRRHCGGEEGGEIGVWKVLHHHVVVVHVGGGGDHGF